MKEFSGVFYREWAAKDPKAILLLVHGLGAHSKRWDFLGEFFLREDLSSYAIELRGFGETKELRGYIDSLGTYLDDIKTLRDKIIKENPDKKIFLIGESMGALLALLIAGEEKRLFDGVVCVSPALKSRIKFSLAEYIHIFSSFVRHPKEQVMMRFDSLMCTRDKEYRKIMDSDPREHRLATLRLLVNLAVAQLKIGALKNKIKTPLLFLIAGEDKIVDPGSSKRFFNKIKLDDKKIILYPEMYHALSIDIGKESVFNDTLNWIKERL
ncbi:MAG: lysophospholipase [Candidatus Omnitrophota bacterium]